MAKKLLFLLLVLSGISIYQSKHLDKNLLETPFTVPAIVVVSNITATSATITCSSIPSSNYLFEYRPSGVGAAWNSAQTNVPILTINSLQSCTKYDVRIRDLSNPSDVSVIVVFTTLSVDNCVSSSTDSGLMHISNVTVTPPPLFGVLPMVSNSGTSNYTDYRSDPTRKVNLVYGSTNNVFSMTKSGPVNPSAAYVNVWIDYNANGIFESAELTVSATSNTNNTIASSFNVPTSAAIGSVINCAVTMRVIFSNTYVSNGCGNFGYGEVEDYGVYLSTTPNLAVNEIEKNKEINICPNPVSDIINISGISSETDFEIYNAAGQKVSSGKISDGKVNVHQLLKGIYFININNKEKTNRLKFIKK
ncbi:GEVED domain-containing protein [Chryseobacterium wangxinyae]|uniref:GEVED domain-containing protein n=1 Tax=Chryseobacterium sp. CY350 TaxID=2997336 RepID=UPI00226FFF43|nr:GEVED domain-containing protein [Chryseobacterium sp. CY350]MCY0978130.1 GEVED domain-containing protein [Chryseobacterium sp. CY350]WBZ95214.1 GEVED domain-containing protein [Chryseobacterium sp. CY350]